MSRRVLEALSVLMLSLPGALSAREVDDATLVHGGGFMGINGQLDIYWSSGYTVAVLSNYDPPAAGALAEKIQGLILRE